LVGIIGDIIDYGQSYGSIVNDIQGAMKKFFLQFFEIKMGYLPCKTRDII
jgi:hypothetical protein